MPKHAQQLNYAAAPTTASILLSTTASDYWHSIPMPDASNMLRDIYDELRAYDAPASATISLSIRIPASELSPLYDDPSYIDASTIVTSDDITYIDVCIDKPGVPVPTFFSNELSPLYDDPSYIDAIIAELRAMHSGLGTVAFNDLATVTVEKDYNLLDDSLIYVCTMAMKFYIAAV